jgi:hypothetical protein
MAVTFQREEAKFGKHFGNHRSGGIFLVENFVRYVSRGNILAGVFQGGIYQGKYIFSNGSHLIKLLKAFLTWGRRELDHKF